MTPLNSKTYKFKHRDSNHAVYLTLVFEGNQVTSIFVNSKEMIAFQWITALMTSYSRQLRSGTPLSEIIADMKETFDPNGAYHLEDGSGREVNSVLHHIGLIIEDNVLNARSDT